MTVEELEVLVSDREAVAIRFIRILAIRLHESGTAAHRLEGAISQVSEKLGFRCEVFSTPTSIFMSFARLDDPTGMTGPTQLVRLRPGSIDVGKLAAVDRIADDVADGLMSLDDGIAGLDAVHDTPPIGGLVGQLTAWAVVGASVASLLGGQWPELLMAAGLAFFTGLLSLRWGTRWQEAGSFEAITAFLITMAAYGLAGLVGEATVATIIIGALIILMPGLDLTIAVTELSTGHLASGTARFAGATVTLLKLAFGVMLATQLVGYLGFDITDGVERSVVSGDWHHWLALAAAGVAFAVLFDANLKDWPAVIGASMLAYISNFLISAQLGPEVGVFCAALIIASVSNGYARFLNKPASIMRLPGIILLVPGSLGYRALTFLFSKNVADGLDAAVSVTLVLAALVGGLLMGNTLVVPRRNL